MEALNEFEAKPSKKSVFDDKKRSVLLQMYAFLLLALQVFCVIFFFCGVVEYYGKTVDLFEAMEMIFDIFQMSGSYYRYIFGAVIGVWYLFVFVFLLIDFFQSVNNLSKLFKKEQTEEE